MGNKNSDPTNRIRDKNTKMSKPKITPLIEVTEMAEGPFWYEKTQSLYFIDMWKRVLHKYTPETKKHTKAVVDGDKPVQFIIPIDDPEATDKFVIGYGTHIASVTWDGVSDKVSKFKIVENIDPNPENRMNDAKVSPSGVLFMGTMGPQLPSGEYAEGCGSLYSYVNCEVKPILSGTSISNGLGWSINEDKLYFADSHDHKIYGFNYNKETVELTNKHVIYDFKKQNTPGFPDGLTVDAEGKIWVATFNGSSVIRIDPENGALMTTIKFDSPQITSVTFGGANLDELYVTSACFQLPEEIKKKFKGHGLFKVENLGVKGITSVPMRLR